MSSWQHAIPQRNLNHEPRPKDMVKKGKTSAMCGECRRAIVLVDDNEGPEMLKALFRF